MIIISWSWLEEDRGSSDSECIWSYILAKRYTPTSSISRGTHGARALDVPCELVEYFCWLNPTRHTVYWSICIYIYIYIFGVWLHRKFGFSRCHGTCNQSFQAATSDRLRQIARPVLCQCFWRCLGSGAVESPTVWPEDPAWISPWKIHRV